MLRKLFSTVPPLLFVILLFAFFLRFVNVTNNPPALYGDELTMVLDVNSILHTGYDTTGKFLPLNFSMGGGRPVGYGYFSIPFVSLLGPGDLGIRLLSIFSGVGIVFLIYILGKMLFTANIGLFGALLMAISPWDLSMSRGGFETHFALFLALLMIVTSLQAVKKPWLLVVSALSFGFSINTYSTYKLSLPLFMPLLFWFLNFKKNLLIAKNLVILIVSSLILLLVLLLLLFQVFLNNSESRFLNQNIFSNKEIESSIVKKIQEDRSLRLGGGVANKLLSNKYWEYGSLVVKNYLNSFSLDFLFLSGDKNPRHNMSAHGSLYLAELITTLFGLAFLLRLEDLKKLALLGGWLIIGPLPGSFLNDPHALRSSFMLPPLVLLSAVGLSFLWNLRKKIFIKFLLLIITLGILMQFIFVVENLFFINPNKYSRFWAYPSKQASEIAIQNKEKYDYIFLSDRIDAIEFAYPVYANINPEKVLEQNKTQIKIEEYQFKKFDNVYIGPIPDSAAQRFLDSLQGVSILYIGPEEDARYLKEGYDVIEGKDKKKSLVIKAIGKKTNLNE